MHFFSTKKLIVSPKDDKTPINKNNCVECLRKISLVIALIKHKHSENKEGLIRDLKLSSNIVFPV